MCLNARDSRPVLHSGALHSSGDVSVTLSFIMAAKPCHDMPCHTFVRHCQPHEQLKWSSMCSRNPFMDLESCPAMNAALPEYAMP